MKLNSYTIQCMCNKFCGNNNFLTGYRITNVSSDLHYVIGTNYPSFPTIFENHKCFSISHSEICTYIV